MWFNYHFLYKSDDTAFLILVFPQENVYPDYFIKNFKNLRKKFKNIHIFLLSWFYRDGLPQIEFLKDYCDSFTILANSREELLFYKINRLNSIYCHHNAFLDENIFKLTDLETKYDIVLNANNNPVKKHYLLKKLTDKYNTLFITYDVVPPEVNDLSLYGVDMQKQINPFSVYRHLNQSKIGLYFTYIDGGCYASSEYLLCGLPVISTVSKGGRDVWYNEKNSIIINPDENELDNAIKYMLDNYDKYDKQQIRDSHISKQMFFRECFIKHVQSIFNKFSIEENARSVFNDNFINKMVNYKSLNVDDLDIFDIDSSLVFY